MAQFEIMNPSDEAYIEGEFHVCCIATLLFGRGQYGLREVDGDKRMPVLFLGGADEWAKSEFGKTWQELFDETSKEELSAALASVQLARERTSMNDFTSYAHDLAKALLKDEKEGGDICDERT